MAIHPSSKCGACCENKPTQRRTMWFGKAGVIGPICDDCFELYEAGTLAEKVEQVHKPSIQTDLERMVLAARNEP